MPSTSFILAAAASQGPSWTSTLGLWAVIIGIFYFLVFAPMRKQKKDLQQLVDSLSKGDKVITTGGLYGTVVSAEGNSVILKFSDNVKIRVLKSHIAGKQGEDPGRDR